MIMWLRRNLKMCPANPTRATTPVPITNLAAIWMESWDGNNTVTARWLSYTAIKPADDWSAGAGSLGRVLRIVE